MKDQQMTERQKQILKAIIESHISDGEPVASKALSQIEAFTCSPATIRNEMAELKNMGYLEQMHTSSGSIPTEAGYRYYVNSLIDRYNITQNEISAIQNNLNQKLSELDQILQEASRLASAFTQLPSIAAKPKIPDSTIDKFDAIFMDVQTFLLVMFFHNGSIETKTIRTTYPLSAEELHTLLNLMNEHLTEKKADEITLPLIIEIENGMGSCASVVNPLIKVIYETMQKKDVGDLKVEGVNKLLGIPDYNNRSEIKEIISILETKEDLLRVISDEGESDDVHVLIGHETDVQGMDQSTLIYRTIKFGGKVLGAIGVIGPKRMDYSKVISVIDHLAAGVDHLLESK